MNTYGYHNSNIRPVSSVYEPDIDVSFHDKKVQTNQGLDFLYIDGLSGFEDSTANNLNYMFLTKTSPVNNILKLNKTVDKYPFFRTTWLKAKDEDNFLITDSNSGTTRLSAASADLTRSSIFELEFLSETEVSIRQYHNGANKFLTATGANSAALDFQARSVPTPDIRDTQIFNYILSDDENVITFVKILSGVYATHPCYITGLTNASDKVLSATQINAANTTPFSGTNRATQFRMRARNAASTVYDLNDTYVTYASGVDHNSLDVNSDKSISNIENNYILHTVINDLKYDDNQMDVNLIPLKNQLTLEGSTAKSNPYSNEETDVTHREYHKLHTGTYQKYGNDSIHASYTTGTKKISLPSDKLTYFHIPQNIQPYTRLNINDCALIKCGAVAGDSPGVSDKVFKKRSEVVKTNTPVDELNGTMLCSWLSGNENSNMTPIWVDRYYNPSYTTKSLALIAGIIEPIPFVDTFDSLTRHLGASANRTPVYDKLSDLAFEPGILYAYHHVGRGNSQKLVDSLKPNILIDLIDKYKTFNDINVTPLFDISGEDYHIDNAGNVSTGIKTTTSSIEIPLLYEFNNDRYGITDIIKNTGSFTLNFWLWSKDWSKPFGNQIIGNHLTKGFGIYNEDNITPFVAIPDGNKIHIYNSSFEYITSHLLEKTINLFTKKGALDNYWIVDDNNDIYEYNINGVIQDKISSSLLTGKQLVDIELSERYLYILISPQTGEEATYFKYDYVRARETGYEGELTTGIIFNFRSGEEATLMSNLSTCKIHSVSKGLSGSVGVLITQQDLLSSNTTYHDTVSGKHNFANGSAIDNNGMPWVLQNGSLYTYSIETSANIQAVSAVALVEGVNIDMDNNVWVLHDFFKVTKLDNLRNKLFTVTLSSMLPLSATRYNRSIDYVAEFSPQGYQRNPVVLVESVSGSRMYTLNSDTGKVLTDVVMVTGQDIAMGMFTTPASARKTYTGFDYLRKTNLNPAPRLLAKATLTDLYNTSTTTQTYSSYTLQYNLSGLSRGWHNFSVTLDAERGEYTMFVDAYRVATQSISGGKFSYSDVFDSPLTIGATPFYTKLLLSEHLNQPQHHLSNGIKLKNIKLYDKPLSYFDIKNHYQVLQDTSDIKWDVPVGQRNYIDTVERVFKHSIPGRKSEYVNIDVRNTQITDDAAINAIKDQIKINLNKEMPIYSRINELGWDSNFTSTSGVEVSAMSVIAKPEVGSQSTTSTLTGDLITYEQ